MCDCAEGKTRRRVNDKRMALAEYAEEETPTGLNKHDCEYVARRNALIPDAVEEVGGEIDSKKTGKALVAEWGRRFMEAMDRLNQERP